MQIYSSLLPDIFEVCRRLHLPCQLLHVEGCSKGSGTMDGMFTLRQLLEKRLEMQGKMGFGFGYLQKAYDIVQRERDGDATLRWMDGRAGSRY